jgi:hypothetical protein
MPFRQGDKVRLKGRSETLTIVRIVGTNAHCCVTRQDETVRSTLLRLTDLELAERVDKIPA